MEEYFQTTINHLKEKLKEKDETIKQLEERLDKNQIIKELDREKAKNKKLEIQLDIEKEKVDTLKRKMLLFSVLNLKKDRRKK